MTPFGKVVILTLVCYFFLEIYKASSKLASRDIGTIFTIENEKTVKASISSKSMSMNPFPLYISAPIVSSNHCMHLSGPLLE